VAKRRFALPGIHELSKQQEEAIRLPMEGCHLTVGGPGTGKTVVTLLRLKRYLQKRENQNSLFLVYNHLLHETAKQLFGNQMKSDTWTKWFMRLYTNQMKDSVPRCGEASGFQPIDWQTVLERLSEMERLDPPTAFFLFIDEGQDMPPQFYQALIQMGFENFYVVSDQNQAITEQNSSRMEIEDCLAINRDVVIELNRNYRNALPVAALAREFYPGDPATPPIELPEESESTQTPLLIEYGSGCRLDFDDVIERILKMSDRDPRKLIGIIAPKNLIREKYVEGLIRVSGSTEISLDNGKPRVETYASGKQCDLRFDEGGIFVINAQSCKGLEFDTVIIADINAFYSNIKIEDEKKRLFYVMVARAIEKVLMLKEAGKPCPVDSILPKDQSVLKYWR